MTESSNGNCFISFYFAKLIVGRFYFQLNALMPSCSIDTFVFKYMKYNNNNNNDGASVEAQRTIDKRTMSLQVRFSLVVVVVSISARINSFPTALRFVPIYLHWIMSNSCRSSNQCPISKKPFVKLGLVS
jgi:hypothetical protein